MLKLGRLCQDSSTIGVMFLREIVHAHIPTLRPQSTIRDAVDKMDIYQFPALVITNDEMEPLAVITEGDLCRAAQTQGGLMKLANESVMTFATPDPYCANPETEVSDALLEMFRQSITILPVVQDKRLHGIVLRVDLMQAMLIDTLPNP